MYVWVDTQALVRCRRCKGEKYIQLPSLTITNYDSLERAYYNRELEIKLQEDPADYTHTEHTNPFFKEKTSVEGQGRDFCNQ